jgi:hypothetical protein
MPDDLPSRDKAVYIFLEMIALGFALEAVASLMRGDVWWKWSGALAAGVLFLVTGVKSKEIILKISPRFVYYLNQRLTWIAIFIVLSFYILQKEPVLDVVMDLHQRWKGWAGYTVFGLFGALLMCGYWWFTGAILKPLPQSRDRKQPTPPIADESPPTLLGLFKKDFSNTLRTSDNEDAYTVQLQGGSIIKIKRQAYMDFPAKAKFVGFYISRPDPPSTDFSGKNTFVACMKLLEIDAVKQTFDHFTNNIAVFGGERGQMNSMQDLTFSGRVFIYHDEFLSITQKADIIQAYQTKKLDVNFRGPEYLGDQVIAWHQEHDPKAAHH